MKYDPVHRRLYSNAVTGHGDPMDIWFPYDWRKISQNDPTLPEPRYITPHLIKHVNPTIKLILMLRNPIERLFSHYHNQRKYEKNLSPEDFHDKVKTSIDIFVKCVLQNGTRACAYDHYIFEQMQVPLTASLYSVFLWDWFKVFDKEQMLIIRSEDYSENIGSTLVKVFEFLDLDNIDLKLLRKMACKQKTYTTNYQTVSGYMLNQTRELLESFYAKSQSDLQNLLAEYHIDLNLDTLHIDEQQMNCLEPVTDVIKMPKLDSTYLKTNSPKQQKVLTYNIHKGKGDKFISIE